MPNALANVPCSQTVPTEPNTLAGLCRRVAALEARLPRKRFVSNGGYLPRLTRKDRCPYGWRPDSRAPAKLVPDAGEFETIHALIELRQNSQFSLRTLCRLLDSTGHKRRGGKKWAGCHKLVRDILRRFNAETPAAAAAFILKQIAEQKARAADRY